MPSGWYTCALRACVCACVGAPAAHAPCTRGSTVCAASAAPCRAAARRARVQRSRSAGSCVCARMRAPRAPAWRVPAPARGSALAVVGTRRDRGIVAWVHEMQRDERDKLRKGLARDKAMLAKKRAERGCRRCRGSHRGARAHAGIERAPAPAACTRAHHAVPFCGGDGDAQRTFFGGALARAVSRRPFPSRLRRARLVKRAMCAHGSVGQRAKGLPGWDSRVGLP